MLEIGHPAPAFSLKDQDGRTVTLEDVAGRWTVLYFYPKDDTPGCTVEACDFTAGIATFSSLDATVLGASPDSPQSHRKFIAKHGLKVRLLSDPGHEAMAAYGAWGEKVLYGRRFVGVIRSTVLIDPRGRIAWRWAKVKTAGHAEAVRGKLEELRGGGGAPAPGKAEPSRPTAKQATAKQATAKKATAKKAAAPRAPKRRPA